MLEINSLLRLNELTMLYSEVYVADLITTYKGRKLGFHSLKLISVKLGWPLSLRRFFLSIIRYLTEQKAICYVLDRKQIFRWTVALDTDASSAVIQSVTSPPEVHATIRPTFSNPSSPHSFLQAMVGAGFPLPSSENVLMEKQLRSSMFSF